MEILNANSASLCNFEVMKHLQKVKERSSGKNSKKREKNKEGQLATITYETLKYLEGTACSQQEPDNITAYVKDLKPFNLSKKEKLILVNTPPVTALDIQVMIEDSVERLTEEQVGQILTITAKYFPHIVKNLKTEQDSE